MRGAWGRMREPLGVPSPGAETRSAGRCLPVAGGPGRAVPPSGPGAPLAAARSRLPSRVFLPGLPGSPLEGQERAKGCSRPFSRGLRGKETRRAGGGAGPPAETPRWPGGPATRGQRPRPRRALRPCRAPGSPAPSGPCRESKARDPRGGGAGVSPSGSPRPARPLRARGPDAPSSPLQPGGCAARGAAPRAAAPAPRQRRRSGVKRDFRG